MDNVLEINELIQNNSMEYSAYVLLHRCLVDVRDGLKPVHRMILCSMFANKTFNLTKSANVSGKVMELHPHGDCLSGQTKIRLLDGTIKTFSELEKQKSCHWVLSVDEKGEIVPALAHSFRKVKRAKTLNVIEFSNGFKIKSTDDHKFKLINGQWVQAKDLKPGQILDYGIINDSGEYLKIYGNNTKSTYMHYLAHDYINGPPAKGMIRHHLDENKTNNNPSNLQCISRTSHRNTHNPNNEISKLGFEKSAHSLFDVHGEFYEKNKQKNSNMAKQLNNQHGLVKANATLTKMENLNMDLTFENYESMRGKVYNLPKIDTLIDRGYIISFEHLVQKYRQGIKFISYEKQQKTPHTHKKTIKHLNKCSQSVAQCANVQRLKNVAISTNFNLDTMKQKPYFEHVSNILPMIVNISCVETDEVVYDFSVEKTHNALICVSDDNKTMAVAHNCYSTIVNLVQKDKQHVPLIDGKGNFGQHTSRDLQPAASRYSEVKLSDMSKDMLFDLNKNVVDFVDNYDGTKKIPVCLPVKYPSVLCYNNIGIGVGMASSICSFNMNEVNECIVEYLTTGHKQVLIPDFPTYGTIKRDKQQLLSINNCGEGSIVIRGKCNIQKNIIEIVEIPYCTTREAIIDKVVKLVKDGKLKSVVSIKDLTDLKGMKIEIVCKKSAKIDEVVDFLYKNTPLESTFNVQMRMLVNGLPKVLGVWGVIDEWLKFRRECIVRGLTHDIQNLKKRKHILDGFEKVVEYIDDIIKIIRGSSDDKVVLNLQEEFMLDEIQAQYIADMKLRNLTKTYINKQLQELDDNIKNTNQFETIIKTPKMIDKIIIDSLLEVNKKFPTPRRSSIV